MIDGLSLKFVQFINRLLTKNIYFRCENRKVLEKNGKLPGFNPYMISEKDNVVEDEGDNMFRRIDPNTTRAELEIAAYDLRRVLTCWGLNFSVVELRMAESQSLDHEANVAKEHYLINQKAKE